MGYALTEPDPAVTRRDAQDDAREVVAEAYAHLARAHAALVVAQHDGARASEIEALAVDLADCLARFRHEVKHAKAVDALPVKRRGPYLTETRARLVGGHDATPLTAALTRSTR